ncbi:NUDIX domain-containing protein [Dactylosporangium sp. NPDC049525]|uniref:NUDIX domain-containing protein n=1 Tax=Dactylosporangium sp. NPDC049525 TaxID=3154730 RepID=UPI00342D10DA
MAAASQCEVGGGVREGASGAVVSVLLGEGVAVVAQHGTLPGGKVEHAEDPFDTVVREVAEETGYEARVEQLLGVDSRTRQVQWGDPGGAELHHVGIFYRVQATGGALRHETNGSTDLTRWMPVTEVPDLERSVVLEVGLELHRSAPPSGHVAPIQVAGLLRH